MRKPDVWQRETTPQELADFLWRPPPGFIGAPVIFIRRRLSGILAVTRLRFPGKTGEWPGHIDPRRRDRSLAIFPAHNDAVDQVGGVLDLTHPDVVPVLVALHEPVHIPERSASHRSKSEQREVPLLEPKAQRGKRQRNGPSLDDEQPAVVTRDHTEDGVILLGQIVAQQRLGIRHQLSHAPHPAVPQRQRYPQLTAYRLREACTSR